MNYGNCESEYGEFDFGVSSLKNILVIGEKERVILHEELEKERVVLHEELEKERDFQKGYKHNVKI